MHILVKVKDDKLSFQIRKRLTEEKKASLNTNLITNDELIFSDEYIKKNPVIVTAFLNELVSGYKLNTLSFQNMEVAETFINILSKIKGINSINFESEEVLTYKLCEKMTKMNNLKFVSCKFIPAYMFETLDKYNIIPESRDEILFTSNFMQINDLNTYSSMYYKYTVYLEFPFSAEDFTDFKSFLKINRNLRTLHINIPNRFNLEEIIDILKANKRKNLRIIIHGDIHDAELIDYLKKHNKKLKRKHKLYLKLKYSDKYIKENIVKQTNNNMLRMCALLIILMLSSSLVMVFVDNYTSMKEVAKIQNEIVEFIQDTDPTEIIAEIEKENPEKTVVNDYIASLTALNPDVTGWLKVNNTNIDYAIVQATNNEFYLENNIYKQPDANGWVFLDKNNQKDVLDDNTIIYGHNRFVNGVMFGTLNKTLYSSWYLDPENQIIKYDTLYGSYRFQIFSIYVTPTTKDYIATNFTSDKKKLEFLEMIKSRSVYDFGINLNEDTKVLTLSTCQSDTSRLVVHAALIYD